MAQYKADESSTPSAEKGHYVVDAESRSVAASLSNEELEIRARYDWDTQKRLIRKVDLRLLPLLMLAYLVKNLDANAISYVKTINTGKHTNILKQLDISANDYSWTSTAYTLAFICAELPSTMLLKWQTPRLHFVRIIFLWSVACACQAAAKNLAGLLVARAFLGFFEGGLYPAILTQMAYWYRPDEMGWRFAALIVLSNFAGIIISLVTYGVSFIDGHAGVSGWQWTFIIIGLAGVVLSVVFFFYHIDFPDTAKFLSEEDKAFMEARLPPGSSRASDATFSWAEIKDACRSPSFWMFSTLFFVFNIAMTGYTFWLPTVISELGFKSGPSVQLLNIPPAALYVIFGLLAAWVADNVYVVPRAVWCLGSNLILLGLFGGLAYCKSPGGLYAIICCTAVFYAWYGVLVYPWRAQTLKGGSYTAFTFGFMNMIAQTVGAFSAQIFQSKYAPRYRVPYIVCMAFFAVSCLCISLTWYFTYDTEKEVRQLSKKRNELGKREGVVMGEDITTVGRGLGAAR